MYSKQLNNNTTNKTKLQTTQSSVSCLHSLSCHFSRFFYNFHNRPWSKSSERL